MDNPWQELVNQNGEWVLSKDREAIREFNSRKAKPEHRVHLESLPEPFIGSPNTARVVLLGLNPRHDDKNIQEHRNHEFKSAIRQNLLHEAQQYPFYPLNPAFSHTGAGQWWHTMLSPLKRESGVDDAALSKMLMVIEWFPYHSEKSGLPKSQICVSQSYSLCLAKHMLNNDRAIVLGMRSKAYWLSSDLAFQDVPFLKNKQRPFISRGNMDAGLFEKILKLLRQ